MADEVQPGFGRTGDFIWGFQRHGVEPDIVTLGKPMANGYPMGVVLRPDVVADFGAKARYFNTYGGNPVAAAAGTALLQIIEDEGLRQNAASVGGYLQEGFASLARNFSYIGDVRGAGLFTGVELVSDRQSRTPDARRASALVNGLRERGVLISASGPLANVLKIRPPLIFSKANADLLLEATKDALSLLA